MADPMSRIRAFLSELKRRSVYRVAATYAVVGFVVIQVADLIFPALQIPPWAYRLVVVLVLLGFPVALVLAWAFEMTPEGVRRTSEAPVESETRGPTAGGGEPGTASESPGGPEPGSAGPEAADGTRRKSRLAVQALVGLGLLGGAAVGGWYLVGGGGEPRPPAGETAASDTAGNGVARSDASAPPRIAVLPFEHNARDTGNAFFTRGMYDMVRNRLAGVSSLRILSRRTGEEIAAGDMTAAEIGRAHDVGAILEGQVYRAGDEVRITTQLVDARRDVDLWSQTYEPELSTDQIFEVQEEIAEQITSALEAELTPGEAARIREVPTESMDALDAFLKGRSAVDAFSSSRDPRDIDRGISHLREALRRDSTLAEAHARLAEGFAYRHVTSGEERWLDSASVAVDRAHALDSDLTSALVAQARIHFEREEFGEAETLLRRVLDREPSNAEATSLLGEVFYRTGQPVKTVRWAHRLVRLAPRDWSAMGAMGWSLELVGFTDPAKAWHERSLETAPDQVGAYGPRAMLRSRTDPEEALEIMRGFLERHPEDPTGLGIAAGIALRADRPELTRTYLERQTEGWRQRARGGSPSMPEGIEFGMGYRMTLGMSEVLLGDEDRGRDLLEEALESARSRASREEVAESWGRTLILAEVEAAVGEHEQALQTLERGLERTQPVVRDVPMFPVSLADPYFDSLRSDPRFREIEREVERRRQAIREEIRDLGIDLYPPGSAGDAAGQGV